MQGELQLVTSDESSVCFRIELPLAGSDKS